MRGLRKRLTVGLALLMCALIGPCDGSAPSVAPGAAGRDAHRGHAGARTEAPLTSRVRTPSVEHRDLRNVNADRADQIVVIFPRDLRKKEKFLKHITGPLYFSPKCRKHMDRLYYQTRDCTIPAYFKRCARLLTRLAGSPQCTEG